MLPVFYADKHAKHHPKLYFKGGVFHEHPEVPGRADSIMAALKKEGVAVSKPDAFGPGPRAAVHTPEYLDFLATIYPRWREISDNEEVVPNIHPGRRMDSLPAHVIGQVGYFTTDLSTPIGPDSWEAACQAADCAVSATRAVLDGAREAYSLHRPPGHHAFPDMAGGFCLLNNIAIAADYALRQGWRPAIVDIDVHAGNGTQGVFYGRGDVLTVSLHGDPKDFYPFFAGHAHERGEGAGLGANFNIPLPLGTGDNAYLDALGGALGRIEAFGPDILFVALGFDGYEKDPFEGFNLTTQGFNRIATAIGEAGYPTVLVQEGGYNRDDLGMNLVSFLKGFMAGRK